MRFAKNWSGNTPDEAARHFEQAARDLPAAIAQAVGETLIDGLKLVRQYSSGTQTPADLARADHPYARRHAQPVPFINRQSGMFEDAWRIQEPVPVAGSIEGGLVNDDPKAGWLLEGTRSMWARPVHERVAVELGPVLEKRLAEAVEEVLG